MADMTGGQKIGSNQGKGVAAGNGLENFLKVFGGEVLTAFQRRAVAMPNFMVRTIQNGKSASFPVLGRTSASYLAAGKSLDDVRKDIKHSEVVIEIDGLLTTDVLIYDIEDAMNHYDVRGEYSAQIGEALAIAADGAVLAELAILCNRPAASNENIAGLGKATVLEIGSTFTDEAARGKKIIETLSKARAALTKNYVPSADRKFYTTPDNYSAILSALMPNSANYSAMIDPETGNIRNVVGFEIVEVPHLTHGGAGDVKPANPGDDVGSTQKHAIPATATKAAPVALDNVEGLFAHRSAVGTVKLRDMALERARRPEYQADQIIGRYAMGHKGLRPEACGALVKAIPST